ncbi:MAG: hypothetical protein LDLANPLL_01612 [Turneriella sp.]|nr:hypothetical protein [Turneriella sp.]
MGFFAHLRERYLNSGSRHFTETTDLKRNRMLNMLFSMAFVSGIYIALIELAFAYILLKRDYARYTTYLLPFISISLVYPLLVALTVFLKNSTGSFHVTLLNNIFINGFCFALALFLGEKAQMHLIILSQFPIIFLFYRYGSWKAITAHLILVLIGLGATLTSYQTMQPLYPLPPDLENIPGYLCWIATFAMLAWYSIYNWKLVYTTEKLLKTERDQTKELLSETIPKLEKAESKFRQLVDGSEDLIFLLDTQLTILNMNKASQSMLAFLPKEMLEKNLLSFIADSPYPQQTTSKDILREQVSQLLLTGKPTRFRTRFIHKNREDGVEVVLILQLSRFNQETEIMARAVEVEPEVMLQFLNLEKGDYTLDNDILHADIVSERIGDRIAPYYTSQQLNLLRTCIREILINAIEHGNLAVSFEEKTRIIEERDFMEFLRERQKDVKYTARRVHIEYTITHNQFTIQITDEGEGFDHKGFIKRAAEDDSLLLLEHGRGITMTQNAFDEVHFNEKGNQVTLVKNHAQKMGA